MTQTEGLPVLARRACPRLSVAVTQREATDASRKAQGQAQSISKSLVPAWCAGAPGPEVSSAEAGPDSGKGTGLPSGGWPLPHLASPSGTG